MEGKVIYSQKYDSSMREQFIEKWRGILRSTPPGEAVDFFQCSDYSHDRRDIPDKEKRVDEAITVAHIFSFTTGIGLDVIQSDSALEIILYPGDFMIRFDILQLMKKMNDFYIQITPDGKSLEIHFLLNLKVECD